MNQANTADVQEFLAQFDYAFNDVDEAQVRQLVEAAFIKQGENLLVLGGNGTGKTEIARTIGSEALRLDLSCHYLQPPGNCLSACSTLLECCALVQQNSPRFIAELLECDALVVEEADRWLKDAPITFTILLCKRIELGKTNILVMSTPRWKDLLFPDQRFRAPSNDRLIPTLLESSAGNPWTNVFQRAGKLSFDLQVRMFGLGFTTPFSEPDMVSYLDRIRVPAAKPARILCAQFDLFLASWPRAIEIMDAMYDRPPIWHVLYTGEKSYRQKLAG